ncbi:MAG: hypothetical protein Q7T87_08260 [Polaromonas sp.]|nr:hypothetical protein [Polaromonas sp.]
MESSFGKAQGLMEGDATDLVFSGVIELNAFLEFNFTQRQI